MYASNVLFFKDFSLHSFFYCWIYFFCFVASYIFFYYIFAKRIERKKDFDTIINEIPYLKSIPYNEMANRNWDFIEKTTSPIEKVKNLKNTYNKGINDGQRKAFKILHDKISSLYGLSKQEWIDKVWYMITNVHFISNNKAQETIKRNAK